MRLRSLAVCSVVALIVVGAGSAAVKSSGMGMGPATKVTRNAFHGYYDGHKDTYLNTDVSDKAEAAGMHINSSARSPANRATRRSGRRRS